MKRFGVEQERFPHLKALNGIQSVACFLWAAALLAVAGRKEGANLPPVWAYWRPGVTNSIGPACGFEALKSISYPAQVMRSRARQSLSRGHPLQGQSCSRMHSCSRRLPARPQTF